jgi:small-conductance mechanosensitive channel
MHKWRRFWLIVALVVLLLVNLLPRSYAQVGGSIPEPSAADLSAPEAQAFPVRLDDKTLFTIQTATSEMYASQRARIAAEEIRRIAQNYSISLDTLVMRPNREIFIISQIRPDDQLSFILVVTSNDAEAARRPQKVLAEDWLNAIKAGIREYRADHSLKRRIFSATATAIATLSLILLILIINRLIAFIHRYLNTWEQTRAQTIHFQNLEILTVSAQKLLLQHLLSLLRWLLIIACLFTYSLVITFFFPQTEAVGTQIISGFNHFFGSVWAAWVNFLPNLATILIAVLIARFLLRANQLIFEALENGRITWPGFYPDWARPTRNLLTLFIWVATIAIVFPYLPVSHSPAIQGLGILLGALLTVGGAGTVASLISGYVVIYSRAFQVGDLVSFDNYQGFVYQKSVLATQIRSFEGEILTIPNAALQSKTIINHSAIIRDLKSPLIIHTTLTLGYDSPWRQIHQVLVEAAKATPNILQEPPPFVLQTSLDDFYVSYQLRAYINQPEHILQIYSDLLQNLQDHCNAAGIEIMSPHYAAMRDGNQTTIPANYLPQGYIRPGFQIELPNPSGGASSK